MNQDLLAQLRDIHLPDAAGWWPPAPGWWLLAAIILVLITSAALMLQRQRRAQAYRREAETLLLNAWDLYQLNGDGSGYVQSMNEIIRRAALRAYSRSGDGTGAKPVGSVALAGQAWLDFLAATAPGIAIRLQSPLGQDFANAPYRPRVKPEQVRDFHHLALTWLRSHRPKPPLLAVVPKAASPTPEPAFKPNAQRRAAGA